MDVIGEVLLQLLIKSTF